MTEDPLTQRLLRRVIGKARLMRLIRAGWLVPHSLVGENGPNQGSNSAS